MIDFKPSQVQLELWFVNTFDRFEPEHTAAVIVKVLAMNGDEWRPAQLTELSEGFKTLTADEGPWRTEWNNPFVKVDMHDLVKRGYAEFRGDDAIAFTEKGLERMRKWVTA